MANGETIESYVPARLDALPWSSWHWLIVVSLGATWILDGLEVTLAGALGGILTRPETLGLTPARVGASATCYLAGAVLGALLFGYATDRFGRKKLFFITVAVYLIGTALSAFSWSFWSYAFFRALTGAGIGGEYAAINSAIDELIPARVRGRVDLIINGSYWVGAALGAAATLVLLDPRRIPIWLGWRFAFGIGATLGLVVIFFRRWIPESPRWLMIHGRNREAEEIVSEVERQIVGAKRAAVSDRGYSEAAAHAHSNADAYAMARNLGRDRARASTPLGSGFCADADPGFFLQRDLFYLRTGPDAVLQRARAKCGQLSVAVCVGERARSRVAWAFLRHNRTQEDDHCYVRARRNFTRDHRLAFSRRRPHGTNADCCMDDYFLHRVSCSELGVLDCERNFPVGNPGIGDRNFLCNRNTGRRCRCTAALWVDYRHWIDYRVVRGISGGGGADDFWRSG